MIDRPPMGWNSWNTFGADINEKLIFEIADAMVDTGLRDAGYEYLVIDDCWSLRERNEAGDLVPDPEKFPNGMKHIADYVHSKGLKFGMYACSGEYTCAGFPGSYLHEFRDAEKFASWDVDYLKLDNCMKPDVPSPTLYNTMGMALRYVDRDILYSMCNWGRDDSWKWARSVGASIYRSTGDISDNYESMRDIAKSQLKNLPFTAPGCYNDLDMLITGMYGKGNVALGGCTESEYRFHFALWCFLQSPLMIGCDVRHMSQATRETLTNKELIRLNQDLECRQPFLVSKYGDSRVYFKHLENNEYALACFNFGDAAVKRFDDTSNWIPFEPYRIGLHERLGYAFDMYDVMTGERRIGGIGRFFDFHIGAHDFGIYRAKLRPIEELKKEHLI